ncbi:MAG: TadE/TadG family type IV pilus assembly protein [Acidimicrobiia bacterium]
MGRPVSVASEDRGAAIVEMAILLPILLLLVIGVFELGGAFKDYLTTSNAVREGTRILSARGTDPTADCVAVVAAVSSMTTATNLDDLVSVEIFEADPDGDPEPGTTNTYTYSSGDPTICTSTAPNCGSWNCTIQQPPSSRSALVGPGVSPDLVGMKIIYTHDWYSNFPPFTGSITIDEQTISRLEPEGLG